MACQRNFLYSALLESKHNFYKLVNTETIINQTYKINLEL